MFIFETPLRLLDADFTRAIRGGPGFAMVGAQAEVDVKTAHGRRWDESVF